MGIKDVLRNSLIKKTSTTILTYYLRIKEENSGLKEYKIIEYLLSARKPFWVCGPAGEVRFKGVFAFQVPENPAIQDLIILVNIWETIIIQPRDLASQSITTSELRSMVFELVRSVISVLNDRGANISLSQQASTADEYNVYLTMVINRLGGKIESSN